MGKDSSSPILFWRMPQKRIGDVGTSISQQMLNEIRLKKTPSKVNLALRKLHLLKIK